MSYGELKILRGRHVDDPHIDDPRHEAAVEYVNSRLSVKTTRIRAPADQRRVIVTP